MQGAVGLIMGVQGALGLSMGVQGAVGLTMEPGGAGGCGTGYGGLGCAGSCGTEPGAWGCLRLTPRDWQGAGASARFGSVWGYRGKQGVPGVGVGLGGCKHVGTGGCGRVQGPCGPVRCSRP